MRIFKIWFLLPLLVSATLAQEAWAENVLSLDRTSYPVAENGGSANIIVRLARTNSDTVTVNYAASDGTAVAGSDYTTTLGTLTFGPNDTAQLIQVPIIDDLVPENTEQFTLTISDASGATIDGTMSTAMIQILDNDNSGTVIGLSADNYSVNETSGMVTVTVTRTGDLSHEDVVNFATRPGSATGGAQADPGVDFQDTSGTLTFAANDLAPQTFTVQIYDDAAVEGNETFAVNLSGSGSYGFDRSTATVTIIDNEISTVNFSASSYSVAENAGNATITLLRTGNTNTAARVRISTVGGTATADVDYASITGLNVDFTQGQTFATVTIPIFDDNAVEGTESFYVSLTASPDSGVVVPGGSATAEVRIVDNENANTVEFAGTDFSVNEQDGSALVTVRLNRGGNSNDTVTVQYFTETGSATPGVDYTAITPQSNSRLTFAPGETIKTFSVTIVNDTIPENTETIGLVLASPTNATLGANSAATLSILDNDSAGTVQFSNANYSVSENSGSVTLIVLLNRTGNTNSAVSVNFTTVAGSAADTRFVPTSGTINFAPSSAVATVVIPVLNDSVIQPPQNFFVLLSSPVNASLGSPSSATVTIQDDDGLNTVEFDAAQYGAVEIELAAQVRVRAVRGGDPNQVLSVNLTLGATGDTAVNPDDYGNPSSLTVTFPAGVSVQSVTIPIINNLAPQGVKTFTVGLTNPGSFTSIGRQSSSRVTIFDNSGPNTAQFLTAAHRFREGDQAAIAVTVVRFGAFDVNGTTVSYATELRAGDTAQAGVNFTPVSGDIRFAPLLDRIGDPPRTVVVDNEHVKTIIIPVPDNTMIEGDLTFHLTLLSSDVAQLGSVSTTQITITDDDLGNVIQFSSANFSVVENGGNAVLTVNLIPNGDASRASSVDYAATGISAFAGFDFSPVIGTLTFAPGERSKTILVPINDDDIVEDSERFRVTLSNPSPGTIIGTPPNSIVTIIDNDTGPNPTPTPGSASIVHFSQESFSAVTTEPNVSLTVTLDRVDGDTGTFTVNYATQDGSAIASRDYQQSSGTLLFASGQSQQTIVIPLLPQSLPAPGSAFTVTLSGPSRGALGVPSRATVIFFSPDLSTKLMNISTRGPVETGNDVMIAGFIIQGAAVEQVVLRGIGPSLTPLGVVGAINDPTLSLMDANGNQLAFNDDYAVNSESDKQTIAANGLTPGDSREAAILASLTPGTYTAILRGKANGVGLVEAYDISATASSHFVNISTRAKVEQGDNGALIAGFIIAPPENQPGTTRRVVIRAVGPTLSNFGITNALADPTLDIYRGSQLIFSNDNWKSNSSSDQQELRSLNIAPSNDRESALVITLDPGSYSAVIRGKNNTTGVGLAEVYQISQ